MSTVIKPFHRDLEKPRNSAYIEDRSELKFYKKLAERARESCKNIGLGFEAGNICIDGYPHFIINWHHASNGTGTIHSEELDNLVVHLENHDPIKKKQQKLFN